MNPTIDMESHTGLRGFCALWVMLFHAFYYSSYGYAIMLNGSVAMPIFFVLSGFSLGVVYGGDNSHQFDKWDFYRNRLARTYPIYILTLLLAIGLIWTDFGLIDPEDRKEMPSWEIMTMIIMNILLINMWFIGIPITVSPINGPSWFLSVLCFQYLIFPFTLPYMKRITNKRLYIFWLYVTQCIISSVLIVTTQDFFIATMNVAAPGFCMFHAGILCGLWSEERGKRESNNSVHDDLQQLTTTDTESDSIVNDNPMTSHLLDGCDTVQDKTMKWAKTTDIYTFIFFSWNVISSILVVFKIDYGASFWIQIYGSPLAMIFIVSLTLDNGTSRFAKLCRLAPSKWLGKIGLSLYLVHFSVIRYFSLTCQMIDSNLVHMTDYSPMFGGSMPIWGVLIIVPLSLLLASILERYVETPCRKLLRSHNPNTQSTISSAVEVPK